MSDERKYRHRGYQSSDDSSNERKSSQAPPTKKDGPRGRGLGAPTETVFRCVACNHKRVIADPIEIETNCAGCGAPLHACANCVSFDPGSRFECRRWEEVPVRVVKKRDRNDCALFEPKTTSEFAAERAPSKPGKPSEARSAFDALFKNI